MAKGTLELRIENVARFYKRRCDRLRDEIKLLREDVAVLRSRVEGMEGDYSDDGPDPGDAFEAFPY